MCKCRVPVCEVMKETAARMGPTGRPGLDPESGVKNLPLTPPALRNQIHTRQINRPKSIKSIKSVMYVQVDSYSSLPAHLLVLQVYDGSYSLKVASSSPSHPGAHCDHSHEVETGRTPLTQSRRRHV